MSTARLQAFLYLLMRDDLVPGRVEKLVREVEGIKVPPDFEGGEGAWLAHYAAELSTRLGVECPPAPVAEIRLQTGDIVGTIGWDGSLTPAAAVPGGTVLLCADRDDLGAPIRLTDREVVVACHFLGRTPEHDEHEDPSLRDEAHDLMRKIEAARPGGSGLGSTS